MPNSQKYCEDESDNICKTLVECTTPPEVTQGTLSLLEALPRNTWAKVTFASLQEMDQ